MVRLLLTLSPLLLLVSPADILRAQNAGSLDAAFSPNVSGEVNALAPQPDGKILLGGRFNFVNGQPSRPAIARLLGDGSVEGISGFDAGAGASSDVLAIAVQEDGKILIGGIFTSVDGQARGGIARLHADGSLEDEATFHPDSGLSGAIYSIVIQPDRKILLGGSFTGVTGPLRGGVIRLNADGSVESATTYNPGSGANSTVYALALQTDGKILLGGQFESVNGEPRKGIARLLPNGTLESTATFNVSTVWRSFSGEVFCIVVQPDGKILLGGAFTGVNGQARNNIARINANGTVESTATFNPGSGAADTISTGAVRSIALQTDGKILLGGQFSSVNGQMRNRIARLTANGSVEGTGTFNAGTASDSDVYGVMLQPDGGILAGGQFTTWNGQTRNHLVRLANGAAMQSLTIPDTTRVRWLRSGTAPEVGQLSFDLSTDNGASWSPLGAPARTAGGWELTGLSLLASGLIRARGRSTGGEYNGSSTVIEMQAAFPPAPEIAVEQPRFVPVASGESRSFGRVPVAVPSAESVLQFLVRNTGNADLTGLALSVEGEDANSFSIITPLAATLSGPAGSATFSIRFAPRTTGAKTATLLVASSDSDENPFRILLTGFGAPAGLLDQAFAPAFDGFSPRGTTVQPDGKILVWGRITRAAGTVVGGIARLLPDGTLEGTATFNPGTGVNVLGGANINSVALQSDGKILLAGNFTAVSGQAHKGLARLQPNGALESAATFNIGTGSDNGILTLAVQLDGRILAGGWFRTFNDLPRASLARLLPNGTLENSAAFVAEINDASNCVTSMALQEDGKILIAGSFISVNGQARYHLARLLSDGTLESAATFNPPITDSDIVTNVASLPDGRILIWGLFPRGEGEQPAWLIALRSDGTAEGPDTWSPGAVPNGAVISVTAQADGRIVIAGNFTNVDGQPRNRIARLSPNGSVESLETFDAGTGIDGFVTGLSQQPDGAILATGNFYAVNGSPRKWIARFHNDVATQELTVPRYDRIIWTRGGSSPEVTAVSFELSSTGTDWTPLTAAHRAGGAWQGRGFMLPSTGQVRARGRTIAGLQNGGESVGLVESVAAFSLAPEISVRGDVELTDGQRAPVDYGTVRQGSPAEISFTVSSTGTFPLTVTSITVPDGYSASGLSPLPLSIPPGEVVAVTIRLNAAGAGTFAGTVSIHSDDFDEASFDFPVTGTVVTPEIAVHDGNADGPELSDGEFAPVDFGKNVQGTPGTRRFTIANSGTAELLISSLTVPPGYTALNLPALPLTLGINQIVTFQIALTTPTAGTHAGRVMLASDDLDEALFDFPLTGEVFIPEPVGSVMSTATTLNRQSGLREHTIHLTNDTTATVPAYNLIIRGLPAGVEVNNASGTRADGSVVVYIRQGMLPHSAQDIVIEYYSPNRAPLELNPQVSTEVILNPPDLTVPPGEASLTIDNVTRLAGGEMMIGFISVPGTRYQMQYSNDGLTWQASLPLVSASGNRTQWIDRGLPRTESHPSRAGSRFYRVREVALP